jgi:hypothetical protein
MVKTHMYLFLLPLPLAVPSGFPMSSLFRFPELLLSHFPILLAPNAASFCWGGSCDRIAFSKCAFTSSEGWMKVGLPRLDPDVDDMRMAIYINAGGWLFVVRGWMEKVQ